MRRSLGTAAAALAMAVLVGCSAPTPSDSGGADSGAGGCSGVPEAAPDTPGDPDPERQVVTTAIASVSVEDPADGAQRLSELVETAGGRVEERSEQAASGRTGAPPPTSWCACHRMR